VLKLISGLGSDKEILMTRVVTYFVVD